MVRLRGLGEGIGRSRLGIGQDPAAKINACSRLLITCPAHGSS